MSGDEMLTTQLVTMLNWTDGDRFALSLALQEEGCNVSRLRSALHGALRKHTFRARESGNIAEEDE